MSDAERDRLTLFAQRLARARGLDPARVEVRVYRPQSGYSAGKRWRATTWYAAALGDSYDRTSSRGDVSASLCDGYTAAEAVDDAIAEVRQHLREVIARESATADHARRRVDVWRAVQEALADGHR